MRCRSCKLTLRRQARRPIRGIQDHDLGEHNGNELEFIRAPADHERLSVAKPAGYPSFHRVIHFDPKKRGLLGFWARSNCVKVNLMEKPFSVSNFLSVEREDRFPHAAPAAMQPAFR